MDETARTSVYALDHPGTPSFPALSGEQTTEIAIIGGGLTGLSTALSLAEAGRDVRVLEAHLPGWGASERNGGQLNPGLKYDPSVMLSKFGEARGSALVDFAWSSVEKTQPPSLWTLVSTASAISRISDRFGSRPLQPCASSLRVSMSRA